MIIIGLNVVQKRFGYGSEVVEMWLRICNFCYFSVILCCLFLPDGFSQYFSTLFFIIFSGSLPTFLVAQLK